MDNFEIPREQQKVKEVKKLSDGTIQIPYSKETTIWTLEFDLRIKKGKDGSARIENKTPITEKNKGYIRILLTQKRLHNHSEKPLIIT